MASRQSLSVALANRAGAGPRPALILDQEQWDGDIGLVTRAGMMNFLGMMLFGGGDDGEDEWNPSARCGLDGNLMQVVVYAYPSPVSLSFNIAATRGVLSAGEIEEPYRLEMVQVNMQKEIRTEYPATEILVVAERGSLYDGDGTIVPMPHYRVGADGVIELAGAVYGTIGVLYRTYRYKYTLDVSGRDPAITPENLLSSVVYAWWDGDGEWLEIEPAPGAEEMVQDGRDCGWGGKTTGQVPDKPVSRPVAAGANRSIGIEYCSNTVESDTTTPWTEWGEDQ